MKMSYKSFKKADHMEISYLLARVLGILFIVIAGAMLINQKFYMIVWQDVSKHPILLVISGFISLICGLLIINVHNIWIANWRGLITLFGWMFVIGGACRLIIPEIILKIWQKMMACRYTISIIAGIMLLIGIYLSYFGFRSIF
jgi:hypothetical protein